MSSFIDDAFGENLSAAQKADRIEALKAAMDHMVAKQASGRGRYYDRRVSQWVGRDERPEFEAAAEKLQSLSKSLDAGQAAEVQAALDAMKDIDSGGPFTDYPGGSQFTPGGPGVGSPGNLRPYDLSAPAKILVPRFTPLRNELPRIHGEGGAFEYRRILGYSNANMGGVADLDIFLDSEFGNVDGTGQAGVFFGGLNLRRGAKISYAMDAHAVPYVEASVSDMVTTKAYFSSLGYENVRALSAMAVLWSHMLGEEKALLFGRGSAAGYAGNFTGTPPTPVVTLNTASTGTIPAGALTVALTIRAGVGETAAGTASTAVTVVAGDTITVTTPANPPAGAYGYNVYGLTGGNVYFIDFIPAGELATSLTYSSLGALVGTAYNSVNTTASNGYDGLLTVLTNPAVSGYVNTNPGLISANGDKFIQDANEALYQNVYADPDEVWLNVVQSRALGDWLKSSGGATGSANTSYRIQMTDNGQGTVGSIVTGIYNESSPTRKMEDLRVHPYMPYGCAIVRSRTLDIPDSGIGDTSEVVSVQEYQSYEWPQIQFTYDQSTYWMGTFVHYAPAWSGAITGLST